MLSQQMLTPGDLVWRDGLPAWAPLGSVAELATAPPVAPMASTMQRGAVPAIDDELKEHSDTKQPMNRFI
jgi:hypothetical protein